MAKRCRVYKPMAQEGYNFSGISNPITYLNQLSEADTGSNNSLDKEAYFNAWNQTSQGQRYPYSTDLNPNPDGTSYSPLGFSPPPAQDKGPTITNIEGSYNPQLGKGPNLKKRPVFGKGGGLDRDKDYGSKKKPYPSVSSEDFAGGGRSYPIPTRADAVDALRLAGLHGRSDVKAKVYAKYPDLKKELGGQPTMTQDSQQDPVHLEKSNNFIKWLHGTNNAAQVQQMMDEDMMLLDSMAQYGTEIPYYLDNGLELLPENDTETFNKIFEQQNIENSYINAPSNTQEFVPGGPDDPFKKDKSKNLFNSNPDKSNPEHVNEVQGIIAGAQLATSFADYAERRKKEEELKKKFSDVFQTHGIAGADRGDYLANVPGIGTNFKPDQTTLMGYNTKIAREGGANETESGYDVNDELDLSESEINKLIEQGYDLEYLD